MKSILLICGISLLTILSGCNKSEEKKDLSYSFTENDCPTGTVTYKDQADYCAALKDDARNNYCASGLRYNQFKTSCPGQSWN